MGYPVGHPPVHLQMDNCRPRQVPCRPRGSIDFRGCSKQTHMLLRKARDTSWSTRDLPSESMLVAGHTITTERKSKGICFGWSLSAYVVCTSNPIGPGCYDQVPQVRQLICETVRRQSQTNVPLSVMYSTWSLSPEQDPVYPGHFSAALTIAELPLGLRLPN